MPEFLEHQPGLLFVVATLLPLASFLVLLLVGAAPEFHLGLVGRAPDWVQRWGLEWVYRLLKEPRRLARRYLVDDTRFALLVWREVRHGS